MQKITTFLWFDDNAEEAVTFYLSIFNNSRILSISRYQEGGPKPAGAVMVITFQLEGQQFMALNAGPEFKFTPAISLLVSCETQEEIDRMWEKLGVGGESMGCGWMRDKYGLCWQIVPPILLEMMMDKDPHKAQRVMAAMLKMQKLDIQAFKDAYEGIG
jgi:predicted 3-demethylubiquinone-9 3-methyltransferase (glyoxalase superfamily)